MKKIIVIIGIFIALGFGAFVFVYRTSATKEVSEEFKFELLSRGNIQNIVSSTGTLEAVGTVEIGSQIVGTVDRVYVDYNDRVKKGQLLAVIDKTALEASVREAKASLARSEAQLKQAQTEYDRNKKLFEDGLIAELTFLEKETEVTTATASVVSAQASLEGSQTNLNYAEIRSPIAGTVLERSVEAGQTLSSNSDDTLFIIAEDLASMQIEALVDESDIGQIREGMGVRFTVQAYPDDEFTGTVRQIRLNPTVEQDVVNYTVIVDAQNEAGTLLPGMTATVDFIVEERFDVLLVPNTALYFQPSQETREQLQGQFQPQSSTNPVNTSQSQPQPPIDAQGPQAFEANARQRPSGERPQRPASGNGMQWPPPPGNQDQMFPGSNIADGQMPFASGQEAGEHMGTGANMQSNDTGKMARVYYLDDTGELAMARFVAGPTDGANTEVVQSTQLGVGTRVITGIETTEKASEKKSFLSSLRLPGLGGGGPGGGPDGGPGGGPPPGGAF